MATKRKRKNLPVHDVQRKLAAQRFDWQNCATAPLVMDRLLQDDGPLILDSLHDAALPVCDALVNELCGDDVVIRYSYRVAVKEDGEIVHRVNDANAGKGRLDFACEIGAGWQSEVDTNAPLVALLHLRGILASFARLPATDHARMHAYRTVLRWFRLAFEVPYVWADGDSRAQAQRRGTPARAARIAWIRRNVASKNLTTEAKLQKIMIAYGIKRRQAQKDLSEARGA